MKALWYILYKTVTENTRPIVFFFKKNYGSGGRTKIFLNSHNSAHTCRIEKRFSVFCSSSDALSDDISLTQKVKKKISTFWWQSASVTSQFVLLTKKSKKSFRSLIVVHRASLVKTQIASIFGRNLKLMNIISLNIFFLALRPKYSSRNIYSLTTHIVRFLCFC